MGLELDMSRLTLNLVQPVREEDKTGRRYTTWVVTPWKWPNIDTPGPLYNGRFSPWPKGVVTLPAAKAIWEARGTDPGGCLHSTSHQNLRIPDRME